MKKLVPAIAIVAALVIAVMATQASADGGAKVIHGSWMCAVGWSDASWSTEGDCSVQNVLTADGSYHLVLHGQIPEDAMGDFLAAGSPKQFATICLVNWRFWVESGGSDDMLYTSSVRTFTPNGQMTEVCEPSVP